MCNLIWSLIKHFLSHPTSAKDLQWNESSPCKISFFILHHWNSNNVKNIYLPDFMVLWDPKLCIFHPKCLPPQFVNMYICSIWGQQKIYIQYFLWILHFTKRRTHTQTQTSENNWERIYQMRISSEKRLQDCFPSNL